MVEDGFRTAEAASDAPADAAADVNRRGAENDARDAARVLAANIIRVVRGAGRPDEIGLQAVALVEAMQRHWETTQSWPNEEIANELRLASREPRTVDGIWSEWESAEHRMITGALQIAASRLIDQPTQEAAGRREMITGLMRIEAIRNSVSKAFR